jgi:glycosyltransferase involved in cell wall biosynthesis
MVEISIVVPLKGSCSHFSQAINSIKSQSFRNWEVLVCVDELDQTTDSFLRDISAWDSRFRILEARGLNLPESLNLGVKNSRGKYIARFDGDDLMLPNRLLNQFRFLESNPDYVACGGQVLLIDEKSRLNLVHPYYFLGNAVLKTKLFYNCPFPHPGVLFRKNAFLQINGYDVSFKHAEDFELWLRLSKVGKFRNLSQPILAYRISPNQKSQRFSRETSESMYLSVVSYLSNEERLNVKYEGSGNLARVESLISSLSLESRKLLFWHKGVIEILKSDSKLKPTVNEIKWLSTVGLHLINRVSDKMIYFIAQSYYVVFVFLVWRRKFRGFIIRLTQT